ncbi:MAG: penicillin-binding protein 1A [Cyanobacteria bacterium]|nr:penicillin-binding protein 1A [Cyanobacteriota bacterium]
MVKFDFNRFKKSSNTDSPDETEPPVRRSRRTRRTLSPKLSHLKYGAGDLWEQVKDKFPRPLRKTRNQVALAFLFVGLGGLTYGYWTIESELPEISSFSAFVRPGTLTVKAMDGTAILQTGPATRDKLPLDKLPKQVINAFIAAEDRRFYQHQGVDYLGLMRAIGRNVSKGEMLEGGSTLTQQLARMVFLNQDRSLIRKIREAMLAQKLEREVSKDKILEKYLNMVYLGSEAYGVGDAAWVYFSKPVSELTLGESAMIAGLPPAPSDYSPIVNADVAKIRRDIVLERMLEQGFISANEASKARSEAITLKPETPKYLYSNSPYFTSYVQQELPKYVSKDILEYGGLTVETTLNPEWQKAAEEAIQETIKLDGPGQGFEQAALVAIDPRNGEIRALVGGYDYYKESQFNRVTQAQRQPGSTFKAFVYGAGIAAGFSPYRGYLDAPYVVDGYEPKNYGGKYSGGTLDMRSALTKSVNVVAVKILLDVGFEPVIDLAKRAGIESPMQDTYSLALGAYEVNLLELTSSYGMFAAKGQHIKSHAITRIVDNKGKEIYKAKYESEQVMDAESAAITTWMMQGVVNNGTGSPAALPDRAVAGKTGTSEQARDLWFVGYIPQMVAGVWLGNDDSAPTAGSSGTAAATWGQFMRKVIKGMPEEKFAELPKDLDDRKGTIKAKKVTPNKSYSKNVPSTPEKSDWRDRPVEETKQSKRRDSVSESEASPNSNSSSPNYEPTPPVQNVAPPERYKPDPAPVKPPLPSRDPEPYIPPAIRDPDPIAPEPPGPVPPVAAPPVPKIKRVF